MIRSLEILYNEGSDSIVIGDTVSHDDIAEIFHNERHTVNQTVEQALETARLFAAAPKLLAALEEALAHIAAMTNQVQQFVEPSGYTAFDRKRIAFAHDQEARESLFMGDMIYLLDGPEQRSLSEQARIAIAEATGIPA